jgi:hypothetical protein
MRVFTGISGGLLSLAINVFGQTTTRETAAVVEPAADRWSFSFTASGNFVPGTRDYLQPTFTADHAWLHLEARYNYEDIDTASTWIGYNFSIGNEMTLEFTPMLGGVFGDTMGVAPGYELTLSYWKLELFSESELVFDTGDSSDSFFYTWSQLTFSPADWCQIGFVIQRTRAYETDRDIQRGFLIGISYRTLNLTTCVFNPDKSRPNMVVALEFTF